MGLNLAFRSVKTIGTALIDLHLYHAKTQFAQLNMQHFRVFRKKIILEKIPTYF